jgi:excisionase family DNA binding protein
MAEEKLCFSPREVMGMLGLSHVTIYRLLHENRISHIRLNRRILIPRGSLEKFLSERRCGSAGASGEENNHLW